MKLLNHSLKKSAARERRRFWTVSSGSGSLPSSRRSVQKTVRWA